MSRYFDMLMEQTDRDQVLRLRWSPSPEERAFAQRVSRAITHCAKDGCTGWPHATVDGIELCLGQGEGGPAWYCPQMMGAYYLRCLHPEAYI